MDRMLYIAMNGATQVVRAQAVNANNLANASTTGFRADLEAFSSLPLSGPGFDSRAYAVSEGQGVDYSYGSITSTGNKLDLAINGEGWIAVQSVDGSEGYTRAGNLKVNEVGQLLTENDLPVLGNNGPIAIPPFETLNIGDDGTISIRPVGQEANTLATVNRIRLVNPDVDNLYKGRDGLLRTIDGSQVDADANVKVASGAIETSNVNPIAALTNMISLSRQFEMHVKVMETAKQNDTISLELLNIEQR